MHAVGGTGRCEPRPLILKNITRFGAHPSSAHATRSMHQPCMHVFPASGSCRLGTCLPAGLLHSTLHHPSRPPLPYMGSEGQAPVAAHGQGHELSSCTGQYKHGVNPCSAPSLLQSLHNFYKSRPTAANWPACTRRGTAELPHLLVCALPRSSEGGEKSTSMAWMKWGWW